jgi:hypothetical protein
MTHPGRAAGLLFLLLAFVVALSSCGDRQTAPAGPASTLAIVARAAAADPTLAALVEARPGAFMRVPDLDTEDAESRGRIVSEGWRNTRAQRFSDLGVRMPRTADGRVDIGVSRFERLRLRVSLRDAAAVPATLHEGRVLYANALPHTDRLFASSAVALEELLVLHDERAPVRFQWMVELPEGIAEAGLSRGRLVFRDPNGRSVLSMPAPVAFDAHGARVPLEMGWQQGVLTLSLPDTPGAQPLAYPLVIDPKYETSSWLDVASRDPGFLGGLGMVFDKARGEIVIFGGYDGWGGEKNETWAWDGKRWTRRRPAISPSARAYFGMVYDQARAEVVMFGGANGQGSLGDTWVWNGVTWAQRTTGPSPSPRSDHTMVYDEARAQVVLFGGQKQDGSELGDTWIWNGTIWAQKSPAHTPSPRKDAPASFDGSQVMLFGGCTAGPNYNDTWTWDGADWIIKAPPTSPSPRCQGQLVHDTIRGELVLFGGYADGYNADTWVWKGGTWQLRVPPQAAAAKYHYGAAFDPLRGELLTYGGYAGAFIDDMWSWNGSTWTRRGLETTPSARFSSAAAFDVARSEVILFGGADDDTFFSDTWAWDGTAWSPRPTAPGATPVARSSHSLTADPARGELVLFGGRNTQLLGDTWVWNGAWVKKTPASSPSPRARHRAVYDSTRKQVVLFGGNGLSGEADFVGDTWVWDGTNWTSRPSGPPPRGSHTMAFDAARGEVVLYGGVRIGGYLDDTWTWNGATWSLRSPQRTPTMRYVGGAAYDAARGETVLFGGLNPTNAGIYVDETWVWDGGEWNQRTTTNAPPPRGFHVMVHDPVRAELLLFGGTDAARVMNDTWLHRTLGGACVAAADCPSSSCTDGVCCIVPSCGTCETCAGSSPGRCTAVLNAEDPDTCASKDNKSCSSVGECKLALGVAAPTGDACASGNLVDGVCCATAKCGICETCDVAKKEIAQFPGQCSAARVDTDPRDDCKDEGAASCGSNGSCDGRGRCQLHKSGTKCGESVCSGSRATGQLCTGAGACAQNAAGVDCAPFACRDGGCVDRCATDADCVATHRCDAGKCVSKEAASCTEDGLSLRSPDGRTVTSCGVYRCVGDRCLAQCSAVEDCAAGLFCDYANRCVSAPAPAALTGCNSTNGTAPWEGLLLVVGLVGLTRRQRPRASSRTPCASPTPRR